MSFSYYNPVQIHFDVDILESLQNLAENELSSKRILLVTSKSFSNNKSSLGNHCVDFINTASQDSSDMESKRANLAQSIAKIFSNIIIFDGVSPNPQLESLQRTKAKIQGRYDAVIALGGGSVLDSAKFFALHNEIVAKNGSLEIVGEARAMPLFACPSTAGTGSELTQWATIWDKGANVKYSLSHKCLYPQIAFYDISLLLSLPLSLSIHTTLDSLSHAVESIWNKNANPISTQYAKATIELILENLPPLYEMLTSMDSKQNLDFTPNAPVEVSLDNFKDCEDSCAETSHKGLSTSKKQISLKSTQEITQIRRNLALACIQSALSFSNTQTALAHAISYPITMQCGVPHGLACSFTLPILLDCISDEKADSILSPYKQGIKNLFETLHISSNPRDYGLDSTMIEEIFSSLNARAKNGLLDVAKAKRRMLGLLWQ